MYVLDENHCVTILNSELGETSLYPVYLGRKAVARDSLMSHKGLGEFHCPYGLTVDASGVLYACDTYNNRI